MLQQVGKKSRACGSLLCGAEAENEHNEDANIIGWVRPPPVLSRVRDAAVWGIAGRNVLAGTAVKDLGIHLDTLVT